MRAFIFDLDGTLLNTLPDLANSCNAILKKYKFPQHPQEAYRQMVGDGFSKLVERALPPDYRPGDEKLEELIAEAKEYYSKNMMNETMPYPGMTAALAMLSSAGAVLGVLSNKPDTLTKILVPHYFPTISFAAIEGSLPDLPFKPEPDTLLAMLRKLDLDAESSCYVGDSNVDIFTAQNAGIMPVGAAWGFRGEEELREAGAKIVLEGPWDLAELLPLHA